MLPVPTATRDELGEFGYATEQLKGDVRNLAVPTVFSTAQTMSAARFEPSGWSGNPKIGYAKSIVDYIFRWLELKFITSDEGNVFEALQTVNSSWTGETSAGPVDVFGERTQMRHAPAGGVSIDA